MKGLRILLFESLLIVGVIYSVGALLNKPTLPFWVAATTGLSSVLILPKDAYSKSPSSS